MTAIVSVDFDWSIESCDKAPHDLDYERNTEKYGRAMKLTIGKSKSSGFSETIAAFDLKVGRCRQLIEIMKVCE